MCGFNVHEPYLAMDILGLDDDGRNKILKDYEFRIRNLVTSPQWLIYYG